MNVTGEDVGRLLLQSDGTAVVLTVVVLTFIG
jgi:hypothetical protein